jgi:methylmalonyl-CoA mutase
VLERYQSSPHTLEEWQKLATKSIKGGFLDDLRWHTPESIAVKPLYTAEDINNLPYTNTFSGLEPFIRGP